MEIFICFFLLGNELFLRVNLYNNIDGLRYRVKERGKFLGENWCECIIDNILVFILIRERYFYWLLLYSICL